MPLRNLQARMRNLSQGVSKGILPREEQMLHESYVIIDWNSQCQGSGTFLRAVPKEALEVPHI